MINLLNLGSFLLGLIAWILPVVSLTRYKKSSHNWITLAIISISACALALCLQIFYHYHLVRIKDWSALMDTMDAVAFVAGVLLLVTIILNTVTLVVYRRRIAQ